MRQGMPWVLLGVGIAAMGAIVQMGACTKSIEDSGESTCGPMANDGNPCTIEVCEGSTVTRENAPPDTNCQVGDISGKCNNGECQVTCAEGQCPALTKCQTSECANGTCVISNKPMGPNPDEADTVAGDCLVPGCDGAGKEVKEGVHVDEDRPADENCVTYTCEGGLLKTSNVEEGEACTIDTAKVCASSGMCVTCIPSTDMGCTAPAVCHEEPPGSPLCSTCYNGVQDPNESAVDCGGMSDCNRCALGESCTTNKDCIELNMQGAQYCASKDGVCCDGSCLATCESCKFPGFEGMCVYVPPGEFDPPDMTCLCNASSDDCEMDATKAKNGDPCEADSGCASGQCVCPISGCTVATKGICKQPEKSVCKKAEQCAGVCVNDACQQCGMGAMDHKCPAGVPCMNGDCVYPPAVP